MEVGKIDFNQGEQETLNMIALYLALIVSDFKDSLHSHCEKSSIIVIIKVILTFLVIALILIYYLTMGNIKPRDAAPRRLRREVNHGKKSTEFSFPDDYHAIGVLQLPYGNITEPFEAWYSGGNKMSRIDYYGG